MLTARVHVFSDSVFCTGPGALEPTTASKKWEKKADDDMKNNSCKNRNDMAGQSMVIE